MATSWFDTCRSGFVSSPLRCLCVPQPLVIRSLEPTSSFSAEVSSLTCRKGGAYDNYGRKIELFKEVRTVFTELKELDIPLAAASR